MNENSLLALLARLCGDITINDNTDPNAIIQLQQAIASAIISEPGIAFSNLFQFEELDKFSTHHLDATDLEHLNSVLQGVQENQQNIDPTIRVFRREVPFLSSQVKRSIPDWARGAGITESLGPFTSRDGRKFWFDLYRVIPVVQVWLEGAAQPFMLLPLEVRNLIIRRGPLSFKIPKGSVWLHADLFATAAPDNLYCGLTIADGTLTLTTSLTVNAANQLIIPQGVEVAVNLNLEQKIITDISPDDNGIDIKEATIELPKTLNFTLNHTGQSMEAGAASWNLYGQPINFAFDNTRPMRWSPEINRILLPYKADVTEMEVLQCKSPVCTISGKAPIVESLWGLSAAVININAPLEADGTGAMAVVILQGIEASWMGLKDANLFEKSSAQLTNALVMLMPGRINIATLFASNPNGKQRYNCWQETVNGVEKPMQYVDLQYTKQFFFFYDSLQKGTESVAAQANCFNSIDKPVQVNGIPFKVESLQTVFTLSISKDLQIVLLYDDDIIKDNFLKNNKPVPGVVPVITFETTAIALNNALLNVSPVYSMLLYGDLKTEDSFDKCLLIYSFGLLQYLPTLPDPYVANISLLKRRQVRDANNAVVADNQPNLYNIAAINAMLVCIMNWQNTDSPSVNFFLGDKPANAVPNPFINNNVAVVKNGTRLSNLQNQELIGNSMRTNLSATLSIQNKNWQAATENNEIANAMLNDDMQAMMRLNDRMSQGNITPFRNAFTLLDVSTNADLMGVTLGFSNDQFIFERTHDVQDDNTGSPISISGMDVQATSRLVQMYALPQISWEPVINITTEITNVAKDPFPGLLYFLNDGVPAQIANIGNKPVAIAPIPLSKKLTEWYKTIPDFAAWSFFTLPYGMLALAKYQKQADGNSPALELIEKQFSNDLHTALQIKTVGLDDPINNNKKFYGSAHQLDNTYNLFFPATGARSMLSGTVTEIFNGEFGSVNGFDLNMYVPLERYDFSGYGANVFSHWVNENAALAQTSQAMFDVWRGRTAHEVVQVKSVVYPWGIRVVRTITIYRGSNGFPWRIDSGWKAESDGIYDFRSPVKDPGGLAGAIADENLHAYKFHPGAVEGVYNVRNIKEDTTLLPFTKPWSKDYGVYIDNQGHPAAANPPNPPQALDIKLVPVYFDADVQIDDVTQGASDGKVLSQRMLGYLQLSPKGVFIDEESFAELLTVMNGLGGPVDCTLKINQTKQQMRIARVEVNPSMDEANKRVFVTAAKGTPVLPKDGSWSVVEYNLSSKEVTPLSNNEVIPLIRKGIRDFIPATLKYTQDKITNPLNIAASSELFKDLEVRAKQFAFLQSTGENKVLFRNPLFKQGENILKGSIPDLADAYRLMNSKGIFPKLENLPKLDQVGELANQFGVNIIDEGYKLINNTVADAEKKLVQLLPEGPWYIVKTNDVKVYIEYKPTKPNPAENPPGGKAELNFDIDSKAGEWVNKMNDITMVVDLVSFKRLVLIRGKFDTKKGQAPAFIGPELEFGPDLKPIVDILVLLSMIATDASYTEILQKGLKIAMSNSPNNWEYKFQADKEIPVLRFPPPLLDTAAAPLRLEAGLKVGVYFNVSIPLPPTNGIPAPGAGAFVEFYAKLSVMCLSVGVGTIYAVGQVTVRISADTVVGPALYMKFGFGVEAVVALPVIGSVSVYFAVGVEMSLDSTQITIGAFVLFKGRAEILGGIVTVTIQIEASGKVQKRIGGPAAGETNMIAQVTFSLDISICFIININFTESWQEQRQIS